MRFGNTKGVKEIDVGGRFLGRRTNIFKGQWYQRMRVEVTVTCEFLWTKHNEDLQSLETFSVTNFYR